MKFKLAILMITCQSLQAAVYLNHDGSGEVLLLPYYTVNNDLVTLVSISNTTEMSKAIKIKYREGRSGLLNGGYNVYLGPKDVWTFAVIKNNENSQVISNDLSCAPGFSSPMTISPHIEGLNSDEFNEDDVNLFEGMIEVYEMGELNPEIGFGHDITFNDGQPIDCQQLSDNWEADGAWVTSNGEQELMAPSGGLMAAVSITDIGSGISYGYDATALMGFYPDETIYHTSPLIADQPALTNSDNTSLTQYQGEMIQTNWPNGFEAVSAILSKYLLMLDYTNDLNINGQTELVLSMPTKSFHLANPNYNDPFNLPDTTFSDCERFNPDIVDRDGQPRSYVPGNVSPVPPSLCHSANVIKIWDFYLFDPSLYYPILDSENIYPQSIVKGSEGMYQLNFDQFSSKGRNFDNTETHTFYGLPVIGVYFINYSNRNAQPGLLAQYGAAFQFKSQQLITVEAIAVP